MIYPRLYSMTLKGSIDSKAADLYSHQGLGFRGFRVLPFVGQLK